MSTLEREKIPPKEYLLKTSYGYQYTLNNPKYGKCFNKGPVDDNMKKPSNPNKSKYKHILDNKLKA